MATSVHTALNGGFMPRMVQPMSPVTITWFFLKPALRTAALIAMNVPRCGQPAAHRGAAARTLPVQGHQQV